MTGKVAWPQFDDDVLRAMAKWPNVPCCYGWLTLDRRGYWRIQGEIVRHARAQTFLSRHYRGDDAGRWFVQNGPQRVFVDLDYTPWVYRYQPTASFVTHTGIEMSALESVYVDDDGNLLLLTALGIGVVDDRDLTACEALFEDGADAVSPRMLRWRGQRLPLLEVQRAEVSRVFDFAPRPR